MYLWYVQIVTEVETKIIYIYNELFNFLFWEVRSTSLYFFLFIIFVLLIDVTK